MPVPQKETVHYIRHQLQEALKTLDGFPNAQSLCETDPERLTDVSLALLRAEQRILEAVNLPLYREKEVSYLARTCVPDEFCKVLETPEGFFKIVYPAILPKTRTEWYSAKKRKKDPAFAHQLDQEFGMITQQKLTEFLQNNRAVKLSGGQFLLIFRRILPCRGGSASVAFIDNNNVHAAAITNAICEVIGVGDGYRSMSFLYTSVEQQTAKTPVLEVILHGKKQ